MSQRLSSTNRKVLRYVSVSANVKPIRKKKGGTGNDPGAVICANVADPSRIVLITSRIVISRLSLRRSSVSAIETSL